MDDAVRAYFNDEGFVEVTTPALVGHPNLDPNIRPLPVTTTDLSGVSILNWLHTSPELSMKKLLARGSGNIYQIGPVFRDEEHARLHRCWAADHEDASRFEASQRRLGRPGQAVLPRE